MKATLRHETSLLEIVRGSEGPDDINDGFCFVVGFIEQEIKERIARLQAVADDPETGAMAKGTILGKIEGYGYAEAQLAAAWAEFQAHK